MTKITMRAGLVLATLLTAATAHAHGDVTPQDLSKKGLSFPLAEYYSAVLESYEKWAQ